VVVAALLLSGCGVVSTIRRVADSVETNRATIDSFTNHIQSESATPFDVSYVTTGAAPATVRYAVDPPTSLAFSDTSSTGAVTADLIVNASGAYECSPPTTTERPWTCQKVGTGSASGIVDLYTPAHWIAFLRDLALAAGFVGAKVTSSTKVVNGFPLSCVNLVNPGISGTNTICTTSQGVLGYVQVSSDSTAFEIKSYSPSPDPSLFALPVGAQVTVPQTPPNTA
jgi:hypothetical protein